MLEKVKEIVADSLGADVETLTEATSFKEDLGADSFRFIRDGNGVLRKSLKKRFHQKI